MASLTCHQGHVSDGVHLPFSTCKVALSRQSGCAPCCCCDVSRVWSNVCAVLRWDWVKDWRYVMTFITIQARTQFVDRNFLLPFSLRPVSLKIQKLESHISILMVLECQMLRHNSVSHSYHDVRSTIHSFVVFPLDVS